MRGIELFSGAGGMSAGAIMAGIEIKLAVEIDKYAALTYSHNHKGTEVFNNDIRKLKEINIKKEKDIPNILFGGPPCQGFSISNQKTRTINNENNWLFEEFIRVAKLWKPDWIVMENVSGLLLTEKGFFIEKIIKKLKKIGYTVNHKLLNAADHGVPQKRERLFIVGSLHGISFQFPVSKVKKYITVTEALHDLPKLENGSMQNELPYKSEAKSEYAKALRKNLKTSFNHYVTRNSDLVLSRYKHIPQGGNWGHIPINLMKNYKDFTRCHGGIYHRLKENMPSVVIGNYRKNMLIHPVEHRGLSVREAARLQSFPDCFEFKGYLGDQQQQVGNAVPPLLAKEVFQKVMKY
jgi:DNA (cytosine-5)-methyltransferase 1